METVGFSTPTNVNTELSASNMQMKMRRPFDKPDFIGVPGGSGSWQCVFFCRFHFSCLPNITHVAPFRMSVPRRDAVRPSLSSVLPTSSNRFCEPENCMYLLYKRHRFLQSSPPPASWASPLPIPNCIPTGRRDTSLHQVSCVLSAAKSPPD